MGVRTDADEKLDEAAEAIDKAISALSAVVVDGCWGHDDYKSECRDTIEEVFDELRRLRRRLGR